MSRHTKARGDAQAKEIRAWGIRRRSVDINQLALAYYLLARIRVEQQRQAASDDAADGRSVHPSEAA